MGSSVLVAQFYVIMAGSFHYLSWDIMEPISYLMLLGNFTFGFWFYLLNKKDLELSSLQEILTYRFAQRKYRRVGIDIEKHERQLAEVEEIEAYLRYAYDK